MKSTKNRLLALMLAVVTLFGLCAPAQASSIADGTQTCTVALGMRNNYLITTAGTTLRAGDYTYTTNDGLTGAAYCIDHGLDYTDKVLPVTGKYTTSPATAGAFANGYPQHSVETFLGLYLAENAVLSGLTEAEFAYATQVAVWATLGQLGVDGTPYTAGREYLNPPTGDAQQTRVFRAAQLILNMAHTWDRVYQTGMYIRVSEGQRDGNVEIPPDMTLDFAAQRERYGIKREVINGKPYYTKEYIFASATSAYYSDYNIELWADNAPEGTIFTSLDNVELPRSNFREKATWRLPTQPHFGVSSQINNNGYEYWGKAKLCIPVETATNSGEIILNSGAYVMQYEIYLANNEDYTEQSYIIADPSKGTQTADAVLSWGSEITEYGNLQVTKVGGGGEPLAGAEFTLTGSDGSSRTGTTNVRGIVLWTGLSPNVVYTLTETKAPAGYAVVGPQTVSITAAQTTYHTVKDDPQHTITVHKQDTQNNYSLRGAVICFEQIDGSYKTTATTDHAGNIQMNADQLPLGSYKVYEVAAPEGYELDKTAQVVNWDGKRDVTLTFQNTRKLTLILSKKDSQTGYNLPGATFEVYRDGQLVTTVTTQEAGLAYVHDVKVGYYEVKETVAPEGYTLNDKTYGVYINPYDPATTDDPRLVIENAPMPGLRIVKFDSQSGKPLADTTFKVYRDTVLLGTYITNTKGEILLTALEPGTYTVEETAAPDSHTVNSTPQQIELTVGRDTTPTLVFFNTLKPGIHLVKVDSETMEPLADATYLISQVGGSFSREYVTDKSGEIDLSKLEPGAYIVKEVKAPEGYLVDDGTRTIQLNAGQNAQFVFTNTPKPSLTIVKYDPLQNKYLSGAAFRIAKVEDGSHYLDRVTDAQGRITIANLEPGVYSVQETAAPAGYILNPTEYHVELFPGKDAELVVVNEARPSFIIKKYDQQSNRPLADTTFKVYRDTVLVGTYTTDGQGQIRLTNLEPGTYTVEEVAAPDSHVVNSTPQQIELTTGGDTVPTLVFFNTLKPGIHLVKVDSETLAPLPNATYRISKVGGSFSREYVTDKDGEIDLSKLTTGAYQVKEVKAPDGYLVDDGSRTIQLKAGENAQFVFTNTRKPSLSVLKYDPIQKKYLAGATFRVAEVEDGSHYLDRVTDAQGRITITDLEPGVYSVQETAAPTGYVLNSTEYHVELFPGRDSELVVTNEAMPDLKIVKTDAITGEPVQGVTFTVKQADGRTLTTEATDEQGEIFLADMEPGVVEIWEQSVPSSYLLNEEHQLITLVPNKLATVRFQNYPRPGLLVNKVDAITGNPIQGAKFHVTYASNNTFTGEVNDLGNFLTDEKGQFSMRDLQDGWYRVEEVEPAKGYAIKDPAVQEVYIKAGTHKELTYQNTPLSALVVYKYDSQTGEAVKNAVFQVKYLSGTSGSGGTIIGTYKTSANGSFTVTGLKAGTYIVEELASDSGHVIDTAPQTAYISGKEQDVVELYFGNSPKGALLVKKVDAATGKPLSDVEFMVTDSAGAVVGNANGKFVTDSSGSFTVSNITPGTTLVVKETRAKAGYILDDAPQTAQVKAGQTVTLEFRNQPCGALVIVKRDKVTNKPLAGATFKVTTSSGTFVAAQGGTVSSNGLYNTDKEGQIVLSVLEPDTYVVTETKAPKGYELDAAPQTVRVNANDTQTLYFYDTPTPEGSLRIVKLDEASRQPIAGVEFLVTHLDGKRLGTYRTNSQGIITLDELTPGWYTVTETKAAEGYKLDAQPHDVEVRNGKTATVELTNRQSGSALIHKIDAVTGKGIYGVTFLVSDSKGQPVGQYTSDNEGYVYIDGDLADGKYTIREIQQAEGYILDTTPKTVYIEYGGCSTVVWKNTPIRGQLQVVKRSADYNPINGLSAGTLLEGATFEVYNERTGAKVDTIVSRANGLAVSQQLPLGRYVIREVKAPAHYMVNDTPMTAVLEYSGQIIRFEVTNQSAATGVAITKTGPKEAVSGQPVRYVFSGIANTGNVTLDSFYWRDNLPAAVTLGKVVTGSYNRPGTYKVVYKVNNAGDYRTLADNLSTVKSYTLDARPATLGLAANERITEVMFVFGQAPAGFAQVEAPMLYCTAVNGLGAGSSFTNTADAGGVYNGAWVQAVTRWTTSVYGKPTPLPRTGY